MIMDDFVTKPIEKDLGKLLDRLGPDAPLDMTIDGRHVTVGWLQEYIRLNPSLTKNGIDLNDFFDWLTDDVRRMVEEMNNPRQKRIAKPVKPIEQVRKEYKEKCAYFLNAPSVDSLALSEITLPEFIEYLFERDTKLAREVLPFEDERSDEYTLWLSQKRMKVKKIDYSGYLCWRYNPIVFIHVRGKGKDGKDSNLHKLILKNDNGYSIDYLENLEQGEGDFASLPPCTFVGRNNTVSNARYLYAMAFDLDGVGIKQIDGLMKCIESDKVSILMPNIIVNSGHGLHLYYLLKYPVPLFRKNIEVLNKLKRGMTDMLWNDLTSSDWNVQHQGILQSFRIPGTKTKFGEVIKAYHCAAAPLYTLDELNTIPIKPKQLSKEELKELTSMPSYNPSQIKLSEAKNLWPEWYVARVVEKRYTANPWAVKRDVYDWWLNRLRTDSGEIKLHHRYWCVMALVVYAVKCNIPREEVEADALSLVPMLDSLTEVEDNHFTDKDVEDALRAYDEKYNTWPIKMIEQTTLFRIERNRRNKRSQNEHLRRARVVQELDYPNGSWREGNGRKIGSVVSAEDSRCALIVRKWQEENPGCKNKSKCARETGLTRPTVRKWWSQ